MQKLRKHSLVAATILLAFGVLLGSCSGVGDPKGENYPYHHMERGFRNPADSPVRDTTAAGSFFPKFLWKQLTQGPPEMPEDHLMPATQARSALARMNGRDSISWIGHSTYLIRLDGVTVLTDPIFSNRASPVSFAGPKRVPPFGLDLEDLPPIDVVVISHAHYDHLDTRTLDRLPNPQNITAIVPLGLGGYFTKRGYGKVHELDWYDEVTLPARSGAFRLTAYPAIHWSNRSPFDRNRTLWMSYGFSAGGKSVYHTGDTATHPDEFVKIGRHMTRHHQGCDIGLISVGAYEPRAFMMSSHVDPEGGVQIGREVGCRRMTPMHWGTFVLALEPFAEPRSRFIAAAGEQGFVLKIGETISLESRHGDE
ncbi:MAG: MBL fold metallo-hydrolase [Parvibaculales bacterium]